MMTHNTHIITIVQTHTNSEYVVHTNISKYFKFWKLVIGNFNGIKWVKAKAHIECDYLLFSFTIFPFYCISYVIY